MRIALVHARFDRSGGAEGYALRLASGLAARGHEVHAFGRKAVDLPEGVEFHRLGALATGRAIKTWTFARSASKALRHASFDIVQGLGRTLGQTVHRASGGLHRSYLEVVPPRRLSPYDRVVIRLEDTLFSAPDLRAVICPSAWVACDVARFYPASARIVQVITNGVDTTEFCPDGRGDDAARVRHALRIPPEAPICLFVATNFWLKGLDIALRALARLPATHLVVVGPDRDHAFRALARELQVEPRVHFAGRQSSLARWYRGADVLLHPTRYDPCSNVCLEAAACGTPVVTTSRDGASDLLGDDEAGVTVPAPALPDAVARAASELLTRGTSAREAACRIAQQHAQGTHLDAVERLYREVAATGGTR